MNNLHETILNKIEKGELAMKSRWRFIVEGIVMICGLIASSIIIMYLLSFAAFFAHQTGIASGGYYGSPSARMLFASPLWVVIVVLAIAALILAWKIVRKKLTVHRQPLMYSLLGLICLTVLGAWLMQKMSIHHRVQAQIHQHSRNIPGVTQAYRDAFEHERKGIVRGMIIDINTGEKYFIIQTPGNTELRVVLSDTTQRPPRYVFQIGEEILVFGKREDGVIHAIGIRPLCTIGQLKNGYDICYGKRYE